MNDINFEKILFDYVNYFKVFNEYLIEFYNLKDIPYNLSGKEFPKLGVVFIKGEKVNYRFHGQGCTIFWGRLNIFFNIDASEEYNKIILTQGGWVCYLKSYFLNFEEIEKTIDVRKILISFEERGIFIERKIKEYGCFHVSEKWFATMAS
jgi:hypothetical protein